MSTRLLLEKGEAIIRSFEAGARAGEGCGGAASTAELSSRPPSTGVEYFTITDTEGRILADSESRCDRRVYETGLT
jgi:two-component system sensor histidine kinase HydH